MRISGVRVGKVKTLEPNEQTGLTDTVLEIDARYAPIPKDSRAILRQKSLLGETYVELVARHALAGMLQDGGKLPQGQVADRSSSTRSSGPSTRRRARASRSGSTGPGARRKQRASR